MWIETRKDKYIICQGMGKSALLIYHRFWGFVARVDTSTPEESEKNGFCKIYCLLSYQITINEVKKITKDIFGKNWGDLKYTFDVLNDDFIGCCPRIDLNIELKEYHTLKRIYED